MRRKESRVKNIEYLMIANRRYALVPFAVLDSFSRTYENLLAYAQSRDLKELSNVDRDCGDILMGVRNAYPHLLRIALGKTLPANTWDEMTERFLLAFFSEKGTTGRPVAIDSDVIDLTFCEEEFDEAVCVFLAKQP